jgi:hypothetical protein
MRVILYKNHSHYLTSNPTEAMDYKPHSTAD